MRFLELIIKFNKQASKKIQEETKSKKLPEQCLKIKFLTEKAIEKVKSLKKHQELNEAITNIIKAGEEYLKLEEKWVGCQIKKYTCSSLEEQARAMKRYISDITLHQAITLLKISFSRGLDLVIGGSTVENGKLGNDLDLGFKISERYKLSGIKTKIDPRDIKYVVEKINHDCKSTLTPSLEFQPRKRGLFKVEHRWIYDYSLRKNIPDIKDVREFFMRTGFRKEPQQTVIKDGKPFGPSGFLMFTIDGQVTVVRPIIKKGTLEGIKKFW